MITNSHIKIVVADENVVIINGLEITLNAKPGIEVAGKAADCARLQQLAAATQPEVILVDSRLPGINGQQELITGLADEHQAAIILYEQNITIKHAPFYIDKTVQGIVCKHQPLEVLVDSIRTVSANQVYHCPHTRQYFGNDMHRLRKLLDGWSAKELEVLQLILYEKSTKEIADLVHYSPKTIEKMRAQLTARTGSANIMGPIRFALQNHLIHL